MGIHWIAACGALGLRMAGRFEELVPQLRQRELGVQRSGLDDLSAREHQRFADQGVGAEISLAAGPASGRSSGLERPGFLIGAWPAVPSIFAVPSSLTKTDCID